MSDVFENLKALSRIAEEKLEAEIEEKKISPSNHSALNTGLNVKGQEKWSQPDVHNNTAREINLNYINKNKKLRGKFPMKLYNLLSRDEYKDLICWNDSGTGWKVMEQRAFEKVLSQYFKHESFDSFMRQVYTWGFKRIKQGPNIGCYSHPLFQRDKVIPFDEIRPLLYKYKNGMNGSGRKTTKARSSRAKPRARNSSKSGDKGSERSLTTISVASMTMHSEAGTSSEMGLDYLETTECATLRAPLDMGAQPRIQSLQVNEVTNAPLSGQFKNSVDQACYSQLHGVQSFGEESGNMTARFPNLSQLSSQLSQLSQLQQINSLINNGEQTSNAPSFGVNSNNTNNRQELELLHLLNANSNISCGLNQLQRPQPQPQQASLLNTSLDSVLSSSLPLHQANDAINERIGALQALQSRIGEITAIQEILNRDNLLQQSSHHHQQQQQQFAGIPQRVNQRFINNNNSLQLSSLMNTVHNNNGRATCLSDSSLLAGSTTNSNSYSDQVALLARLLSNNNNQNNNMDHSGTGMGQNWNSNSNNMNGAPF